MKRNFLLAVLLVSFTATAQQNISLKKQLQAEFNFQGIELGYQLPIAEKWLLIGDLGGGMTNYIGYSDNGRGKKFL